MNPRRKKRLIMTSSILVGAAFATGLVLYALSQNIDLFYTPTEIVEGKGDAEIKPEVGQRLRVGGLVVPGSVRREGSGLTVSFNLIDVGPAEITVEYEGILPDLFREGQGIVAQGILTDANRIAASEVLAKHDEEYMPPALAEALKGIQHVPPSQQNNSSDYNQGYNQGYNNNEAAEESSGGGYDR
ncbi:cytochrome c maturation protein CcmE [Aliidiomarina iranensis]|uniref:Cytochrome c-type biogenesis protein CcmE n=1 Tax=Aliidiomarina iranensis TaxID=1434071 RepID=A0A432VQ75_9GAMM|nr:cytochrome c maturation protein CcmE [Aliidiomarina iranensis]RUO18313.1 cytochrome c maturation protein CcmE [Aliidiomarina iranensis]